MVEQEIVVQQSDQLPPDVETRHFKIRRRKQLNKSASRHISHVSNYLLERLRPPPPKIHYTTDGGTEFEEIINFTKVELWWNAETQNVIPFKNTKEMTREQLPLHPQIRLEDVWQELCKAEDQIQFDPNEFKGLTDASSSIRIFLLSAIKFDGTAQGIPVSHIYTTNSYNDHKHAERRNVSKI